MNSLALALLRLRAKSPRQLARAMLIRLWPLSLLVRLFFRLRARRWFRDRLNREAVRAFCADMPSLDEVQQRCLKELQEEGVCRTSIEELIGDPGLRDRLHAKVDEILASPAVREQIENRRATNSPKWYVIRGLGYRMKITLPHQLADLLLHPRLLAVINHYQGMYSRLGYADIWYNLPAAEGEPAIDSERWHRDHEDQRVLKIYYYAAAVDESMGPLNYVRGSQPGGVYAGISPARPGVGAYPTAEMVEGTVPCSAQLVCTGDAGTLLLCDTAGLHRGGRASTKPRIVVIGTYVTDAGIDRRTITLDQAELGSNDNRARQYAVGLSGAARRGESSSSLIVL